PTLVLPAVPHRLPQSHAHGLTSDQGPSLDAPSARASAMPDISSLSDLPPSVSVRGARPLIFGYYVNWDATSMVSLRLHLVALTHLVPEWLTMQKAHVDLDYASDPTDF